jgi:tape measure domain-containing protein
VTAPVDRAFVEILPQFKNMNAQLKKGVDESLRGVTRQMENVTKKVNNEAERATASVHNHSMAVGVAIGSLASMGAAAMFGMGKSAITAGLQTAAGMEQAQIAFGTLLHSQKQAKIFLADMADFAAKTPFELPGLIDAARQLLGVGVAAKDIKPLLTAYGDAAGALGIQQDGFNRIMLATSQAMSAGTLHAGDLLQMTEAGLPIWKLLSEALHKPVSVLKDMSEKGQLMTKDVLPKLRAQMEKDYGGSMIKQSQTLSGLWSTLMDTFHQGMAKALIPLEPMLRTLIPRAANFMGRALKYLSDTIGNLIVGIGKGRGPLGFLHDVLGKIKDAAQHMGNFLKPIVDWIKDIVQSGGGAGNILQKVAGYLDDIAKWADRHGAQLRTVGVFVLTFMAAWKGYKFVVAAIDAINAAMALMAANPIGVVVVAIAALVAGTIYAYNHFKTFRDWVDKVGRSFRNFIGDVVAVSKAIAGFFEAGYRDGRSFAKWIEAIPAEVSKFFDSLHDKISTFFSGLHKGIQSGFASAGSWLRDTGKHLIDGMQSGMSTGWKKTNDWLGATLPRIGRAIGDAGRWATDWGIKFITFELRGLSITWHFVTDWFSKSLTWIGRAIGDARGWALNWGRDFIQNELRGLTVVWHIITDWYHGMLTRIGVAIGDHKGWANRLGTQLISYALAGARAMWHVLPDWFRGFIGGIARAIGNWTKWAHDVGWGIITGLLRGLAGTWSTVTSWFSKVPGWIKAALGIHSPPAWAVDAGSWIMKGLVKGLIGGSFNFTSFLKFLTSRARAALTSFMTGAHGSVGAGGLHADILRVLAAIRKQFGSVRLISGLRPGAHTLSGNLSRHAVGEAIDIPAIYSMTKWISQTFGRGLRELISPWNSLNILRGQHHVYTGDIYAQHAGIGRFAGNAHTHVAYETGAWRIPNDQLAYLHAREMVVPAGPADAIRAGATGAHVTHLSDDTIEKLGHAFARAIGGVGSLAMMRSRQYGAR